jgi:ribonuclease HII
VVFAPGSRIPGVDDSKKLDAATRDRLAGEIKQTAAARSIALVEVEEIDAINNYWAVFWQCVARSKASRLEPRTLVFSDGVEVAFQIARNLRDGWRCGSPMTA